MYTHMDYAAAAHYELDVHRATGLPPTKKKKRLRKRFIKEYVR